MAKTKKSGRKKTYHVKKKYTLRNLNEILRELDQKEETGEALTDYDEKLRTATQLAVDLVMNNSKLDLSRDSESHLDQALMMKGLAMLDGGESEGEIIKTLSETCASYLLFEQINLLTSFNVVADVHYNVEESDNLMIKAHMYLNPNNVTFDPYKAMGSVADTCFVFGDVKPYQMGVKNADPIDVVRSIGVNLDPYREVFSKEMLEAL